MIKLKNLLNEKLQNSQGETYTFGKGDIVKDINPDCSHHGAEGKVTKGGKVKITFIVTNNGKNYKEGDELEKTVDQMVKLKEGNIGITTKKGKSIELTHRTSGKEIVVVNTPSVLKKYKKMGYLISMPEGKLDEIAVVTKPKVGDYLRDGSTLFAKIIEIRKDEVITNNMSGKWSKNVTKIAFKLKKLKDSGKRNVGRPIWVPK